MTKRSRFLVLGAALALGFVYLLPVWRITLEAPQYPEGLGMEILIDDIVGVKPHDLNNINNLNHYIGMRRIEPDSIPELVVMPFILAALIAGGVLTAALGRRRVLYLWVALFVGVSAVGIADFWKWEYDYGHNLDRETAAIQIPGMSYQPPLIGSRQILNFTAHSWPGAGGWLALASMLVGVGVAAAEFRRARRASAVDAAPVDAETGGAPTSRTAALLLLAAGGLAAAGCREPEPRPLAFGEESCARCRMSLTDDRYGAELLTVRGRVYPFDSVECLAAFLLEFEPLEVHSAWVTDFERPGSLIRAEDAFFLRSDALKSPMGLGLTSFERREDRDRAREEYGGDALDWEGVLALAESTPVPPHSHPLPAHASRAAPSDAVGSHPDGR